ncbi:MAG: hypothetical protein HDR33_10215 [Treponema sp.]|nr:hypothetical protein [Treponema sp.]
MKRKWIEVVFVAALFAAALAFVACKNIEDGGEIQQPPAPEQGASGGSQGEGQPGGGDNTGNEGENPDEGGDEGDEQKPDEGQNPLQPSGKTVVELLKEIIGENEYDAISAEVAAGNMTLTEEKIKAVGDIFPALEKDAESGKEAKDVENAEIIRQNKEAFIAQNEGKINITKSGIYTLNSYNVLVTFNGEFDLDKISLPANNGKGNFSNATLKNSVYDISIDEFNDIRGSSLPTISSTNISSNSSPKAIYNLYKAYSSNLDKLTLEGNLYRRTIDGKEISGKSDYTLFTDDNKAKLSTNTSIISLSADALAQMTNQLTIYNIRNMIISGNAKTNTVNWQLTNIVFEGDMSNLKNDFKNPNDNLALCLYGIVYFKNKPYNATRMSIGQSVKGMLKLDKLEGVSSNNFKVGFASADYSVLDVSGVDASVLSNYNPTDNKIISDLGMTQAIYFNENLYKSSITQNEINELCFKFVLKSRSGIVNVYLGNYKVKGNEYDLAYSYYNNSAASRIPRTLKEFEYFGNYDKFEKSAYSSYTDTEFKDLPSNEQNQLKNDDGKNKIAQNNRKCFSCVAKSFV